MTILLHNRSKNQLTIPFPRVPLASLAPEEAEVDAKSCMSYFLHLPIPQPNKKKLLFICTKIRLPTIQPVSKCKASFKNSAYFNFVTESLSFIFLTNKHSTNRISNSIIYLRGMGQLELRLEEFSFCCTSFFHFITSSKIDFYSINANNIEEQDA